MSNLEKFCEEFEKEFDIEELAEHIGMIMEDKDDSEDYLEMLRRRN